jgi:hypothetical protein
MMRSPLRLALTPAGLYLPRTSLGPQDAGGSFTSRQQNQQLDSAGGCNAVKSGDLEL